MENEVYLSKNKERRIRIEKAIQKKKNKTMGVLIIILIAVSILVWRIFYDTEKDTSQNLGQLYTDIGQAHVSLETASAYNSNPPSSGDHYGSPANWGIYDYEVNDKIFIHNLEHGGIWIAYHPNKITSEVVEDLKAIYDEFGGSKIIMAPRSANDSDIAVAAWTRVLKFNQVGARLTDIQKNDIRQFYKKFLNKGPEFVPASMPGIDPKSIQETNE